MTPERWHTVADLFERAAACPPAERAALLDAACAGDADLRREVEKMLAADDRTGHLEAPVWEAMPELAAASADDRHQQAAVADRIGPYRIVKPIGRGGMGEVFLATRAVGAAEQTVALKLLRPGLEEERLLQRFAAEQQMLAGLDHPRIARLLDAGQSADGRPYLVMEYVDGEPITTYCDRHRLTVGARLRLFQQVCEAVQAAHQALIVHRDLKPSNVLVSDHTTGAAHTGHVKLLDFGIAKVLNSADGDPALLTQTGRMLTPAYASPEQLVGAPVTTASDIYSLGVLLYELLAGRRPHLLGGRGPIEAARIVSQETATRPSDAVAGGETTRQTAERRRSNPERLQRTLRGDLDQIVLKALHSDPARRYSSAAAFAEDLQRHLDGLPVQARPDTLGYRVGKFVRRQWAGVAAASAFLLLLVAFAGAMAWQQAETARERDRAEREQGRAEQALAESESVADFLVDLFQANNPNEARGDTLSARDLLRRGTDRIASLDEQPAIASRLRLVLGGVYKSLGDLEAASPLIEASLVERQARLGAHPDVIESLQYLAKLHMDEGKFEEADSLAHVAHAMHEALGRPSDLLTLENLRLLATLLKHRGDYDASAARFRELIALERDLGAAAQQRSETLHNYARLLDSQTDYAGAAEAFKQSLALRFVVDPDTNHPSTLVTMSSLGVAYSRLERHEEAVALLRETVGRRRHVLGDDHPGVASTRTAYGIALGASGHYQEALVEYQEAERIYRRSSGDRHPNVSSALYNQARVLQDLGRLYEADAAYREALSIRREAYGPRHTRTALVELFFGRFLNERGQHGEAAALLEQALGSIRDAFGPDHKWARDAETWLAEARDGRRSAAP
jgi:serine/threonine-protein kinase